MKKLALSLCLFGLVAGVLLVGMFAKVWIWPDSVQAAVWIWPDAMRNLL
ncbi:hypothetical protein [Specibacter cremeus]|nr:hypothetical protein [Specibacter cremeus]